MRVSFLSLLEIFRDFVQLASITSLSLGVHLEYPMKFSVVSISDWMSINFVVTFNVKTRTIMASQLILLCLCTLYMIIITIHQFRKRYQGMEAKPMSKFQRYLARSIIFIITTIFAPLAGSSLKVLAGQQDLSGYDFYIMYTLSSISLFLLIFVNPLIFYYGIKYTKPSENYFDDQGGQAIDKREIYYSQLQKVHSPFKELFSLYSYSGANYKLYMMLFKFIRMCLMVTNPVPYGNDIVFWILYGGDILINLIFLFYIMSSQPYHDYRLNRNQNLNSITQICIICLNITLLMIDNQQATDEDTQLIISIVQVSCCATIFLVYFLKTLFSENVIIKVFFKWLYKELSFTPLTLRGIHSFAGAKNRYSNFIYFNSQYYDKRLEVQLNVWEEFWKKLIQNEISLKCKQKIEDLEFLQSGNAPPYLQNFKGTVGERFEENKRIMQKIGKKKYAEEVLNNQRKDYIQLKLDIIENVPPVDAYYEHHMLIEGSGFCRVTFYPFPFTCQLVYDDSNQIIELQGQEYLQFFLKQIRSDVCQKMTEYRLILRSLNGCSIKNRYELKTNRKKQRFSKEKGDMETYTVPAIISYNEGVFSAKSKYPTIIKLQDGSKMDIGRGLICSLYYPKGEGVDSEGDKFVANSFTLPHKELGINYKDPYQGRIAQIVNDNVEIWKVKKADLQVLYKRYQLNFISTMNYKNEILSYDFNVNILGAPFDIICNRKQIEQYLSQEQNFLMKNIIFTYYTQFNQLYEKLERFYSQDFKTYLYFFFADVWNLNQDLLSVKKNRASLDPSLNSCLIYRKDLDMKSIKKILQEKNLRSRFGGGYFNNKLFKNFQKMVTQFQDKPPNFFEVDFQNELKLETKTNEKQANSPDIVVEKDIENQQIYHLQLKLDETVKDQNYLNVKDNLTKSNVCNYSSIQNNTNNNNKIDILFTEQKESEGNTIRSGQINEKIDQFHSFTQNQNNIDISFENKQQFEVQSRNEICQEPIMNNNYDQIKESNAIINNQLQQQETAKDISCELNKQIDQQEKIEGVDTDTMVKEKNQMENKQEEDNYNLDSFKFQNQQQIQQIYRDNLESNYSSEENLVSTLKIIEPIEVKIKANQNRRTSIEEQIIQNKFANQIQDENQPILIDETQQNIKSDTQITTGITIQKRDSMLKEIQEEDYN